MARRWTAEVLLALSQLVASSSFGSSVMLDNTQPSPPGASPPGAASVSRCSPVSASLVSVIFCGRRRVATCQNSMCMRAEQARNRTVCSGPNALLWGRLQPPRLFVLSHSAGAAPRGRNRRFVRYGGSTSNSVIMFCLHRGALAEPAGIPVLLQAARMASATTDAPSSISGL